MVDAALNYSMLCTDSLWLSSHLHRLFAIPGTRTSTSMVVSCSLSISNSTMH
jgi:hypothetical protein